MKLLVFAAYVEVVVSTDVVDDDIVATDKVVGIFDVVAEVLEVSGG